MVQRVASGATQRTSVPGAAAILATCACAIESGGETKQASANGPTMMPRR